jgi:hypothetical protein
VDRSSLKAALDSQHIDPRAYNLTGGLPNEAYTLEQTPSGWSVYYSERGLRSGKQSFTTEDQACRHLLDLLLADQSTHLR